MIDGRKKKILKEFGNTLKKIRKQRGLSLRQLSAASGVEHPQIVKMEHGTRNPTFTTIADLADALEVDPGELFSFER